MNKLQVCFQCARKAARLIPNHGSQIPTVLDNSDPLPYTPRNLNRAKGLDGDEYASKRRHREQVIGENLPERRRRMAPGAAARKVD